jgi:tetratricopeptide (TPR) repeat protein
MNGRKDQHEHDPQGRTEPTLGDLDHLDESPRPKADDGLPRVTLDAGQRRPAPSAGTGGQARPSRRGWLWPVLLLVAIGLGVTFWQQQDRLRGLLPTTELNDVLGRAEQALRDGRLDGNDGTSARELFEAARALEPDNDRARDGLRKVGLAEVGKADAALATGKLDEAEQAMNAARELLGGGSDVDRLAQSIAKARGATFQAGTLVDQAQQAMADGKPEEAGALYKRILTAEPGNAVAAHGLDKVGDALAAQVRKAVEDGNREAASASVDRLAALLPNYGELPSLRAALVQDQKEDDGQLSEAIRQGQAALRAGRITGEGSDTALAHFKQALTLDPDNAQAKAGLGQVAQALVVQANAALDSGDSAQASRLLDQAAELAPKSAELAAARAHLSDATRSAGAGAGTAAGETPQADLHAALTPQQSAELARLVRQAEGAARRGNVMLPPGESAYDLYRQALAIDGNNEAARHGLQELPALVVQQFNQALANGNLQQAGERLSDLGDLAPGEAGQAELRQRLANAWMDQAEERLSGGDRPGAAQALDHARKLAPANPRVSSIAARLQAGG